MEEPIRILQVLASLDRGGAETEIMNLYRHIDRRKVQFDFVVNQRDCPYAYEEEIKALGGRIYYMPKYRIYNIITFAKAWRSLYLGHTEWQIIHGHHTSCAIIYLWIAKQLERITIAHSHTSYGARSLKAYYKYLMRLPLRRLADYLISCSKASADFMFGKDNKRVHLLNNAIEVQNYRFSIGTRERIRKELSLTDKFVIGHIGNFSKPKNYPKLLKVFQKVHEKNNNAILLLIGKKENDPRIIKKIKELKLTDAVILTGVRIDIPDLLCGMDLFVFPSLYEGIPVSLIEAQASGLRCIVSDRVSNEVKLTELVEFISLNHSDEYWCEKILSYQLGYVRKDTQNQICQAGYDISVNAKWLEEYYLLKTPIK